MRVKKVFIKSGKASIYVEFGYPKKTPAPAAIIGHGLRSYYPGFLDIFAKALRQAGYIAVKFHFIGTGKSTGLFEQKTTKAMLQNFLDVLDYVSKQPEVREIGIVARSNAGSLAMIHGPDKRIKVYCLLAPPAFYSRVMGNYVTHGKVRGKFFYNKSFKRPHTKGPGRLPLNFVEELKRYDEPLLKNGKKIKLAILFQSTADEAVLMSEGHFDYWKKHLPKPRKLVLIQGGNHSYKGHKRYVIQETIKWFKKYMPISR